MDSFGNEVPLICKSHWDAFQAIIYGLQQGQFMPTPFSGRCWGRLQHGLCSQNFSRLGAVLGAETSLTDLCTGCEEAAFCCTTPSIPQSLLICCQGGMLTCCQHSFKTLRDAALL